MSRRPRRPAAEVWLFIGIVASQVYYFHRYVFRYDDPGTSPTYAPTPTAWQAGKYLLIPAIAFIAVLAHAGQNRGRLPVVRSRGFATAVFVLICWCMVLTLAAAALSPGGVNQLPKFWFFLPLVLVLALGWEDRASVDRAIKVIGLLVVYHAIFSAWELLAYYSTGRLPALAYPNGGLVRFGGGLDDPNGFAMFLVLPLLCLVAGWPTHMSRLRRTAWFLLLAYLMVKSLSYTGIAGFLVGAIAFLFLGRQVSKGLLFIVGLLTASLGLVITGVADHAIKLKAASAASRLEFSSTIYSSNGESVSAFFHHVSAVSLLFGNPQLAAHTETSYLELAMQFGLPLALAVTLLILVSIRQGAERARLLRGSGHAREARLWAALTAYVVAYAVASLGVPLLSVFPTNLIFWVVVMMLWLPYTPSEDPLPGSQLRGKRGERPDSNRPVLPAKPRQTQPSPA